MIFAIVVVHAAGATVPMPVALIVGLGAALALTAAAILATFDADPPGS